MESEREGWENKEEVEVEMRCKKRRGVFFFFTLKEVVSSLGVYWEK